MAFGDRRRERKRRTLKVRRVIRRVELRSAVKLGLIFHVCCYGVTLGVGALLWHLALRFDLVHNLEKFMSQIGFADDFRIDGPTLWRVGVRGGAILVVLNTIVTWLAAFFYNCVAGLIGGVVVSMLEDAPVARRPPVAAPTRLAVGTPGRTDSPLAPSLNGAAMTAGVGKPSRSDRRKARRTKKKGMPEVAPRAPDDRTPDDPTRSGDMAIEVAPTLVDWADALGPAGEPVGPVVETPDSSRSQG